MSPCARQPYPLILKLTSSAPISNSLEFHPPSWMQLTDALELPGVNEMISKGVDDLFKKPEGMMLMMIGLTPDQVRDHAQLVAAGEGCLAAASLILLILSQMKPLVKPFLQGIAPDVSTLDSVAYHHIIHTCHHTSQTCHHIHASPHLITTPLRRDHLHTPIDPIMCVHASPHHITTPLRRDHLHISQRTPIDPIMCVPSASLSLRRNAVAHSGGTADWQDL